MKRSFKLLSFVLVLVFCLTTISAVFAAETYDGMAQLKKNITEKDSDQKGTQWIAQYRLWADGKWQKWTTMVNMAYDGALYAKSIDGSQPQIGVNDKGVFIAAGQWNQEKVWKNEGARAFVAPKTGTIKLHSGKLSKFIAGDIDAKTKALKKCKGTVAIYKNAIKIWPTNKSYAELTSTKPLDFPKLDVKVVKGDVIRIVCSGTALKAGEQNSDWQTHIVFQPVVEYATVAKK